MNFHEYLLFEATDIVYHYTPVSFAEDILKENRFKLTPVMAVAADESLGHPKLYYMSTARSKVGAYHKNKHHGVVFVLDGRKLNYNYKSKPVDYWGPTASRRETEDRIFSDTPYIPNADKYINEMHVLADVKESAYLMKLASSKNIKSYFYKDQRAWLMQNKNKAIEYDIDSNAEPLEKFTREYGEKPEYFTYIENILSKSIHELSYAESEIVRKIKAGQAPEFAERLRNDIKMPIRYGVENDQKYVHNFLDLMKKNGVRSIDALFELIKKRHTTKEDKKVAFGRSHVSEIYHELREIRHDISDRKHKYIYQGDDWGEKFEIKLIPKKIDSIIELDVDSLDDTYPDINVFIADDIESILDNATSGEFYEIIDEDIEKIRKQLLEY